MKALMILLAIVTLSALACILDPNVQEDLNTKFATVVLDVTAEAKATQEAQNE